VLAKTPNPQTVCYQALHQDYCEEFVGETPHQIEETEAGEIVVKRLLAGGRGHYGPLEHPQITLACGYFPHSTMQQLRTHRVGVSFDCQSFRYTGARLEKFVSKWGDSLTGGEIPIEAKEELEKLVYLRPLGKYKDRIGLMYDYRQDARDRAIALAIESLKLYAENRGAGMPAEQARGLIPFDIRQHWVVSCNARSLLHMLDLRWKDDAQLECQWWCDLAWVHFANWMPQVAVWYEKHRAHRGTLAP
jgi:thymidylate synthase (FAD)